MAVNGDYNTTIISNLFSMLMYKTDVGTSPDIKDLL